MKKFYFYIIFAVFFSLKVLSQTIQLKNAEWQIKPVVNTGFILVHRATIGHLVKGYPTLYELNISQRTNGSKLWHLENNRPDIGLSFQYLDFKNPAQLGYAFSIVPYIEIPLNEKEKKSRLILRLCWGATYLNKHFDIATNPKNIAIGRFVNIEDAIEARRKKALELYGKFFREPQKT